LRKRYYTDAGSLGFVGMLADFATLSLENKYILVSDYFFVLAFPANFYFLFLFRIRVPFARAAVGRRGRSRL
jgi:hypothetical protein